MAVYVVHLTIVSLILCCETLRPRNKCGWGLWSSLSTAVWFYQMEIYQKTIQMLPILQFINTEKIYKSVNRTSVSHCSLIYNNFLFVFISFSLFFAAVVEFFSLWAKKLEPAEFDW